jgi:hypothetical protein
MAVRRSSASVDGGVGNGVFLLQGREGDMRRWLGHLVSDEKHDGEALTINGSQCSHDLAGRVDETADGDETWGKTTARSRMLAM